MAGGMTVEADEFFLFFNPDLAGFSRIWSKIAEGREESPRSIRLRPASAVAKALADKSARHGGGLHELHEGTRVDVLPVRRATLRSLSCSVPQFIFPVRPPFAGTVITWVSIAASLTVKLR